MHRMKPQTVRKEITTSITLTVEELIDVLNKHYDMNLRDDGSRYTDVKVNGNRITVTVKAEKSNKVGELRPLPEEDGT